SSLGSDQSAHGFKTVAGLDGQNIFARSERQHAYWARRVGVEAAVPDCALCSFFVSGNLRHAMASAVQSLSHSAGTFSYSVTAVRTAHSGAAFASSARAEKQPCPVLRFRCHGSRVNFSM